MQGMVSELGTDTVGELPAFFATKLADSSSDSTEDNASDGVSDGAEGSPSHIAEGSPSHVTEGSPSHDGHDHYISVKELSPAEEEEHINSIDPKYDRVDNSQSQSDNVQSRDEL